jgi:hypothetical protein
MAETQTEQYNAETQRIKAVSTNLREGSADDKEFEKRMRLAELTLKKQKQDAEANKKQGGNVSTMFPPTTNPEESQ